jgi:hypothetical protein
MPLKPSAVNYFMFFKLPAAFICGVRAKSITSTSCTTAVTHRWINQNPFKSMFWAVQGMAAELSTGALVMSSIRDSGKSISMLVANNRASFLKKARGRITFTCHDGEAITEAIQTAITTGEGIVCIMRATGHDKEGDIVSQFEFEWSIKLKNRRL